VWVRQPSVGLSAYEVPVDKSTDAFLLCFLAEVLKCYGIEIRHQTVRGLGPHVSHNAFPDPVALLLGLCLVSRAVNEFNGAFRGPYDITYRDLIDLSCEIVPTGRPP